MKRLSGPSTTEMIRRFVLEKLGDGVELEIAFPRGIPRTPRGKHAFIVQRLQVSAEGAAIGAEPIGLSAGRG